MGGLTINWQWQPPGSARLWRCQCMPTCWLIEVDCWQGELKGLMPCTEQLPWLYCTLAIPVALHQARRAAAKHLHKHSEARAGGPQQIGIEV